MEQEVKKEVEVVSDVTSTDDKSGDEVIVQPVDEKDLDAAFKAGVQKPTTDSTETIPSGSSTDDQATTDDSSFKKPVEETLREKALRLQVGALREDLRKASQEKISGYARPPSKEIADERLAKLKNTYSDEEIRNMEEAIDVLATRKGYVKKEETYQEVVNNVLDTFVDSHPEYKPSNDRDDIRWTLFQEVLLNDYNLNGKNSKQLKQIFEKVNRDVSTELGESTVTAHNQNQINAQQQKIKSVSHSGGTQQSNSSGKKPDLDPSVRKMFKGFDDKDLV